MHIVVTGAAGVLGSGVVAGLAKTGLHTIRGVDLRPLPEHIRGLATVDELQANLTDREACSAAVREADVVVHCASIHPWKDYPDELYWDLNVKATHQLLTACVAAKVAKVVLTSSVEPFAGRAFAPEELPLHEDITPSPRRLYGLTKLIGEQIAARFHRVDGLRCQILRPATFIPNEEAVIGPRLLAGTWLYPADVVAAHVRAVGTPLPPSGWDTCFIAPDVPYSPADVAAVRQGGDEAIAVYEQRFPGAVDVLRRHGIPLPSLSVFYSIDHACRALGWRPQRGFADWLECQRDAPPGQLQPSYERQHWRA